MSICEPDDEEHAELISEYLTQIILSQAEDGTSGAASWIEKLF